MFKYSYSVYIVGEKVKNLSIVQSDSSKHMAHMIGSNLKSSDSKYFLCCTFSLF